MWKERGIYGKSKVKSKKMPSNIEHKLGYIFIYITMYSNLITSNLVRLSHEFQ